MIAQDVLDVVEFNLKQLGIEYFTGVGIQFLIEAQNDFAHNTRCLFLEGTKSLTSDTYDYELAGAGEQLLFIHSVTYDLSGIVTPLRSVPKSVMDQHPSFYADSYQDIYSMVERLKVRLHFNPSSSAILKYIYSYEPNNIITSLITTLSIPDIYKRALINYVMWKMLENTDKFDQSDKFHKLYMNATKSDEVRPKMEKIT